MGQRGLGIVAWGLGLGLFFSGCQETQHRTRSSDVALRYLPACAPEVLDQITVEALGDFPTGDDTIVSFDARAGRGTVSSLPAEARLFRMGLSTPTYTGAAIAPAVEGAGSSPALVLPSGIACAVPALSPPPFDAAALAIPDFGPLLVAGGVDAAQGASNQLVDIRVEDAQVERLPEGLFVPRAGACAANAGRVGSTQEIWILGGAPSLVPGTLALNSLERFDPATRQISGLGRLQTPRVHARALSLPDGSVLLAGGERSVGAGPLGTIERVAPGTAEGETLSAALPWVGPLDALSWRDDGVVVLAGQVGDEPRLALLEPSSQQVASVPAPAATWDPSLVVSLPGARLALFETQPDASTGERETTGRLWLVLPDGTQLALSRWLSSFAGLAQARALALDDGRILLTGSRMGSFTARVIDPGRADVRVRALQALPIQLLPRADGSVLMLADGALAVLREGARTRYDNPGGTLLADDTADTSVLALDAPERFRREGLGLVSTAALARFDVTVLRYEDVRIDVRARGPSELLLRRADGAQVAISLGTEESGPVLCKLASDPERSVRIERRGPRVHIRTGLAERSCELAGLEGPIALAVRALEPDVHIDALEVTRF